MKTLILAISLMVSLSFSMAGAAEDPNDSTGRAGANAAATGASDCPGCEAHSLRNCSLSGKTQRCQEGFGNALHLSKTNNGSDSSNADR